MFFLLNYFKILALYLSIPNEPRFEGNKNVAVAIIKFSEHTKTSKEGIKCEEVTKARLKFGCAFYTMNGVPSVGEFWAFVEREADEKSTISGGVSNV